VEASHGLFPEFGRKMLLPNREQAVVDLAKLIGYCLDADHPRGRHKARVFASALGITHAEASFLRETLLIVALEHEVTPALADQYGQRYVLDFMMDGPKGEVAVRSSWIVRTDEDFPRLTSCYVL
jgi:hypothetical protein